MTRSINNDQLYYWSITGYSDSDIQNFCQTHEDKFMIAKVTFQKGAAQVVISQKTWSRQEGHYGTVLKFFSDLAQSEIGKTLEGSIVVWLEDGAYDYTRARTMVVPILAFGRSIDDSQTLLMPDPAFLSSRGYLEDIKEIEEIDTMPFEQKHKRIFWRGAATGTAIDYPDWDKCARGILAKRASELNKPELLDAKITKMDHLSLEQQALFRKLGITGEYLEFSKFLENAYLIDADGFHCAWRSLYLKLASKSVTVKINSPLEQWYFRELKPWVHYVPLMSDLSDVEQVYDWLQTHPERCKEIIQNANNLVRSITFENEVENVANTCKRIIELKRP